MPKKINEYHREQNKHNLFTNPPKLFNFLLVELDNELKNIDINDNNDQIDNNEYKNKSCIEKLFFGINLCKFI